MNRKIIFSIIGGSILIIAVVVLIYFLTKPGDTPGGGGGGGGDTPIYKWSTTPWKKTNTDLYGDEPVKPPDQCEYKINCEQEYVNNNICVQDGTGNVVDDSLCPPPKRPPQNSATCDMCSPCNSMYWVAVDGNNNPLVNPSFYFRFQTTEEQEKKSWATKCSPFCGSGVWFYNSVTKSWPSPTQPPDAIFCKSSYTEPYGVLAGKTITRTTGDYNQRPIIWSDSLGGDPIRMLPTNSPPSSFTPT